MVNRFFSFSKLVGQIRFASTTMRRIDDKAQGLLRNPGPPPLADWAAAFGRPTPASAHNIEDLKLSYAHNLSRNGCIDHATGYLTQPAVLEGTDISKEREALDKIKAALSDVGQLYASYKHSCTEYRMTDEK